MIAVFNWMNVVVYQMGHLFDMCVSIGWFIISSPFLVDGQKCASALFDDFRLSCHHSIRYSAVFEWLLYHGERFIPSQIHEVPITATLECNAGLLLSLWFFSLDHHKAEFSKVHISVIPLFIVYRSTSLSRETPYQAIISGYQQLSDGHTQTRCLEQWICVLQTLLFRVWSSCWGSPFHHSISLLGSVYLSNPLHSSFDLFDWLSWSWSKRDCS